MAADMGQMDIGDDKVGLELQRLRDNIPPVAQRQHLMPMRAQKIAKKFEIEFVVLDNEHALCHQSPAFQDRAIKPVNVRESIMRFHDADGKQDSPPDAADARTLALLALAWTLGDEKRADRLLALTGLDADALRAGVDKPAVLAAVLDFLADHEPDLIACAAAIDTTPEALIATKEMLRR